MVGPPTRPRVPHRPDPLESESELLCTRHAGRGGPLGLPRRRLGRRSGVSLPALQIPLRPRLLRIELGAVTNRSLEEAEKRGVWDSAEPLVEGLDGA